MSYRGITNAGGGRAWGDIYQVNTPYTDQLGQQLYAQEQQRQLQQQRESDALDQQFSKNVANIRDVDVNDYADKYNDWKQAKIGLLKMNPNNMNPSQQKEYIAAQLDANKKLAAMSQLGDASTTAKAELLSTAKSIAADKNGDYKENAPSMVAQANQTPLSKFNTLTTKDDKGNDVPYNPLNPEEFKYQGNTKDWEPVLKKAEGTLSTRATTTPTLTADKLGTSTTEIKAKNSPLEYYTNLVGSLSGAKAVGNLKSAYPFTDDQAQQITEAYQNNILNNPTAKAAWGNGVQLPMNALLTPATRTASLLAMQHALNNAPVETAPKVIPNKGAIMDRQENFQLKKQAIGNQNAISHIKLAAGLRSDAKADDNVVGANAVLSDLHSNLTIGGNTKGLFGENNSNLINVSDPNLIKAFSTVNKIGTTTIPADRITYDKSKKQFNLEYDGINSTDAAGKPIQIPAKSIPISENDVIKEKVKEMNPSKDIGKINEIVNKIVTDKGGLYNAVQSLYNPTQQKQVAPSGGGNVKVQIGGKVYQIPKENLSKMDKDKVSYKLIQ